MIILKGSVAHRGDTKANFENANPVIGERELVIETDTNNFKFGDGVRNYKDLPYALGGGGTIKYPEGEVLCNQDSCFIIVKKALNDTEAFQNFKSAVELISSIETPLQKIVYLNDNNYVDTYNTTTKLYNNPVDLSDTNLLIKGHYRHLNEYSLYSTHNESRDTQKFMSFGVTGTLKANFEDVIIDLEENTTFAQQGYCKFTNCKIYSSGVSFEETVPFIGDINKESLVFFYDCYLEQYHSFPEGNEDSVFSFTNCNIFCESNGSNAKYYFENCKGGFDYSFNCKNGIYINCRSLDPFAPTSLTGENSIYINCEVHTDQDMEPYIFGKSIYINCIKVVHEYDVDLGQFTGNKTYSIVNKLTFG